jgi:hypothetical protein
MLFLLNSRAVKLFYSIFWCFTGINTRIPAQIFSLKKRWFWVGLGYQNPKKSQPKNLKKSLPEKTPKIPYFWDIWDFFGRNLQTLGFLG